MDFRTEIKVEPSCCRITYDDPVMFIGSCFATYIGKKFETGHLPVMINPFGTVFNPASINTTLDRIKKNEPVTRAGLFESNGRWVSLDHYTDFSSEDPDQLIAKVESATDRANRFINKARFLFITFGTARIYRLRSTGEIVSNCHKLPQDLFTEELMKPEMIRDMWISRLDKLQNDFPGLKVIFTISPVRHWKDGAHGNMISKSSLFVAVEDLLKHSSAPLYFPAYELLMDDLRDYRFYDRDMLHPSQEAVDYIWEKFTDCFFDKTVAAIWKEAEKITKGYLHIIKGMNAAETKKFSSVMLKKILELEKKLPGIDFSSEKSHFSNLS